MSEAHAPYVTDAEPARVWHFPAQLARATADRDAEALLKLARAAAFDPGVFEDRPPFFAQAVISNDGLDAYFTRMHLTTLQNYAADAAAGVTVLASHNARQLGVGRSLTGQLVRGRGGELSTVLSDFYTVPGLKLADVSTDDVIEGIRSGLLHDISVGFYGGTEQCAVCGQNYWSWDCMHIAGAEYPILDAKGNETGQVTAFAWIKDAHLAEYSIVYDGATPGAEIITVKAQREADAGRLKPETVRQLEERYRLNLPGRTRHGAGASVAPSAPAEDGEQQARQQPAQGKESEMTDTESRQSQPATDGNASCVRCESRDGLLTARGVLREGETPEQAFSRVLDDLERLRPLADDGRAYRTDLVAEALAEGVRAYGETFAKETYEGVLEKASLDVIKRMRDDWRTLGDKRLPGGRATVEGDGETEPATRSEPELPDAAFRA